MPEDVLRTYIIPMVYNVKELRSCSRYIRIVCNSSPTRVCIAPPPPLSCCSKMLKDVTSVLQEQLQDCKIVDMSREFYQDYKDVRGWTSAIYRSGSSLLTTIMLMLPLSTVCLDLANVPLVDNEIGEALATRLPLMTNLRKLVLFGTYFNKAYMGAVAQVVGLYELDLGIVNIYDKTQRLYLIDSFQKMAANGLRVLKIGGNMLESIKAALSAPVNIVECKYRLRYIPTRFNLV